MQDEINEQELQDNINDAMEAENVGNPEETDELSVLKGKVAELEDKNLRLFAEFENFRRRTQKEKLELMMTAAKDTLSALLPVLDDFDRAKKIVDDVEEKDPFTEGVLLVYNKLFNVLKSKGLQVLESNGQPFDAELHDAISHIPVSDPSLSGKVIDTVERGYLLNDKLIRHAKVVVGA
ncbi:MAG: nucleotide exchange factor GrpE [Saprospiraceae bacterium]|nr:nucleotide exchange factor GrpE [Saprospiraceae bacterium]MBX7179849.1 nucleotide exchange factor GrpE [Saprospiraceae bacterium]MCB0590841.1 nucleotide exchange factor GrpE [Saprospiraceae bacterium]MCO5283907.1 nucleotide exchange factor GrpE [Saprospiraceae bacterium]MCO6469697.1 nucleotide exchange factor GrpE [Saprospiraceae bacterium]